MNKHLKETMKSRKRAQPDYQKVVIQSKVDAEQETKNDKNVTDNQLDNAIITNKDTAEEKKNIEKENEKIELEYKILKKIEKNLIEKKQELEIINSDIYTINEIKKEHPKEDDLKEDQKKVDELLQKLEQMKKQLNLYIKDETIDEAILLDEKDVIDDILDYKRMIEGQVSLKEEYEILEEYIYLVEEIDKVNDRCIELEKKKQDELEQLSINEEKFKSIQLKLVQEDENAERAKDMVVEQESLITELERNINIIEMEHKTIYNYDLLNKLVSLELKYLLLLGLSPLKGALPFIAITTKTTKDAIDMLSNTKLVRTQEQIIYSAKDYSTQIEEMTYKLADMSNMLNESLYSLENIKKEFTNNPELLFNPKYSDFLDKINGIEDILKDNLSKLDIYNQKMNKNKEVNDNKLRKVLQLNSAKK